MATLHQAGHVSSNTLCVVDTKKFDYIPNPLWATQCSSATTPALGTYSLLDLYLSKAMTRLSCLLETHLPQLPVLRS